MPAKHNKGNAGVLLGLHILLFLYSFSGILSKYASQQPFLSFMFCILYCGMLGVLFAYAIGWQQVIKRMPLTLAFANKAITVVWGIIWGIVFFNEQATVQMLIGAVIVIAGIVLFSMDDSDQESSSVGENPASDSDGSFKFGERNVDQGDDA